MFLPLPRLDDRRWSDLVEDALATIPVEAPEWTDHNASDPGVTFAELFAWVAEMRVFQVDQIPAAFRRKLLALAGITSSPPAPARALLRFGGAAGAAPVRLPATLEVEGPGGLRYRIRDPLRVVPAALAELRSETAAGTRDLTGRWRRGEPFAPFGDDPTRGDAFVLGLDAALPVGVPVTIAVRAGDDRAAQGAQLAWEALVAGPRWRRLRPAAHELADGRIVLVVPEPMHDAGGRWLLRARIAAGAYDAAPELRDVAVNGAFAEQSVPAGELRWSIAPGATVVGTPRPGRAQRFELEIDRAGRLRRVAVTGGDAPRLFVLDYRPPSRLSSGSLAVEAARLPGSRGAPHHTVTLAAAPVDEPSVRVWTLEGTGRHARWRRWTLRSDLDASGPADAHAVLDATTGSVRFGDGGRGRVPPAAATLIATYRTTAAQAGGVDAGALDRVADGPHNRALLGGPVAVSVTNPAAGGGGAAAETLEHAEGRALEAATEVTRAVTAADVEWLARRTPGVRLARVAAFPNRHPGLPCVEAVGVITVLILPSLPASRPYPSTATRRAVAAQLERYRLAGTRFEVTGPVYTEVAVAARVRRRAGAPAAGLRDRIAAALATFFDPLRGGPGGDGWPFGRDVVRAEVLQVLDEVEGGEHVVDLELIGPGGRSCGDLCLGPMGLVAAGGHEIEVVA
jgi:predicted phage baseplate assembly protein